MSNIAMSDELSFESNQKVRLVVDYLQLPDKIRAMRENLAEIKKNRNIEQLKEISKYGLY